jgi:ribosomal protein S18 acetylase RimI-like enzyme
VDEHVGSFGRQAGGIVGRPSVSVRGAGTADLTSLLVLVSQARQEDQARQSSRHPVLTDERTRLETLLQRTDVQVMLAHDRPGAEPVGVLVLRRGELLPLTGHQAVHVEQLWVHPDHRKRGVARALLRQAATVAEQSGLDEVVCSVPPTWREAHRFLARLGFAPISAQRAVPVPALLRRLAADGLPGRRTALDQVLARRRRELRPDRRPENRPGALV